MWYEKEKYSKGEYTELIYGITDMASSTCVTLKIHMDHCSGQGQAEYQCKLGVQMATCLYMSFGQGQAEQYDIIIIILSLFSK